MIVNGKDNCHKMKSTSGGLGGNGQVENDGPMEDYCKSVAESHRVFTDSRPWANKIFTIADAMSSRSSFSTPMSWAFGDALEVCNADLMSNKYAYKQATYTGNTKDLEINTNCLSDPSARNTNTLNLQYAQLGIWGIVSSPLFVSADIGQCDPSILDTLKNPKYIKMNQEYSGDPESRISKTTVNGITYSVWRKVINTTIARKTYYLVVSRTDSVIADESDFRNKEVACNMDETFDTIWDTPNDSGHKSHLYACINLHPSPSPTIRPTRSPTTIMPTSSPVTPTTQQPTKEPTNEPTKEPTNEPTKEPTNEPTKEPTNEPTKEPTNEPTKEPTNEPTKEPTNEPTTHSPTLPGETFSPTQSPTKEPTKDPTYFPTKEPTDRPTNAPTTEETTSSDGVYTTIVGAIGGGIAIIGLILYCRSSSSSDKYEKINPY